MTEGPQDLISIKGLKDSDTGTPLRKFKGVLDNFYREDSDFGARCVLQFRDVEVIESTEPYPFPIAQLSMKLSDRKNSTWGVFATSLAQVIPEDKDIKDVTGHELTMEMEEGYKFGENRITGEDMLGNVWRVKAVEGFESPTGETPFERAKSLLIGKTLADFNKVVYSDPLVRQDPDLIRSLTDKSFVQSLIQAGQIKADENGIFIETPTE